MTFREAVEYAALSGISSERVSGDDAVELLLNNGDILVFRSHYDKDPSPNTPGGGIDTPSVELLRRR